MMDIPVETEVTRLAARIARHIPMLLPWSEMSAVMTGRALRDDMTVRDVITTIMEPEISAMLQDLLVTARDEGLLPGTLSNDIESAWVGSWNAWQENVEDPDDLHIITSPLRAIVLSELAWAATPGRYRAGELKDAHMEAPLSRETFESRMLDVIPRLQDALATGTSADWHEGHVEMIGKRSQRRIVMDGWAPAVQKRGGFTLSWEAAEKISQEDRSAAPEMSF